MPNRILQVPLWAPPKEAVGLMARTWTDGKWSMGIKASQFDGPEPHAGDRPQCNPSGVLQYQDLDVLLGLAHHWRMAGKPTNGHLDLSVPDVMRWMGFDSLVGAPYSELRASLWRLRTCEISVWHVSELTGDDTSDVIMRNLGTLLSRADVTRGSRLGLASAMHVVLSETTLGWFSERNQEIDLDVYSYLARHPATRRMALARVLWTHLSSWRALDGTVDIPMGWIGSRWADRRPSTDGSPGKALYYDCFSKESRLFRSFVALAKAGVLPWKRTNERLLGRFICPDGVKRIRDVPRQRRFLDIDFTAIAEAAARGDPEPAPQLIEHNPGPETRELLNGPDLVVVEDDEATAQPATTDTDRPDRLLRHLLTICHVQRPVIDEALNKGWKRKTW